MQMHPRSNVELDVERVTRAGGVEDEGPKEFAQFFRPEGGEEEEEPEQKRESQRGVAVRGQTN